MDASCLEFLAICSPVLLMNILPIHAMANVLARDNQTLYKDRYDHRVIYKVESCVQTDANRDRKKTDKCA